MAMEPTPRPIPVAGGIPLAVSSTGPSTGRTRNGPARRLDWNITPDDMIYFGVTTGTRSGGYNLVFFNTTAPTILRNSPTTSLATRLSGWIVRSRSTVLLLLRLNDHTVATKSPSSVVRRRPWWKRPGGNHGCKRISSGSRITSPWGVTSATRRANTEDLFV